VPKVLINGVPTEVSFDQILNDDDSPLTIPAPGSYFTQEQVNERLEAVRQEEKDKLYGRIDSLTQQITDLTNQVGGLTAEQQREKAAAEEERARLEAEARRAEEEDLDAKALVERSRQEWEQNLNQVNQQWEQRFTEEQQRREAAEALAQREREFGELRDYTLSAVEANKDNIAPQLLGWISGNSKEEVDAAIQRAIDTTNQIMEEVQQVVGQPQEQQPFVYDQQPQPPALPGTRATAGPANSDPAGQTQQLTADQIKNMTIDQYAALRGKIGIGGQSQSRGLFG
jgi:hypothetical protein